MAIPDIKARLHVEHALGQHTVLEVDSKQDHYLRSVMRLQTSDRVGLFNGQDGEWCARPVPGRRKPLLLECVLKLREQEALPDVWLLFAPLKKSRTDYVIEKATEIGVSRIIPVCTRFTNSRRISRSRLWQVAREAAEQCHGMAVPEIDELTGLHEVLGNWPDDRRLLVCDETMLNHADCEEAELQDVKLAVLVGPEGGFSQEERNRIAKMEFATAVGLGPRLLRAETAVAAALTLANIRQFRSGS